uniref:Uncharacterized protein n=1 Tax=Arundo donax TaxID=35708 RepID=A0A0A9EFE8_ARUDO
MKFPFRFQLRLLFVLKHISSKQREKCYLRPQEGREKESRRNPWKNSTSWKLEQWLGPLPSKTGGNDFFLFKKQAWMKITAWKVSSLHIQKSEPNNKAQNSMYDLAN